MRFPVQERTLAEVTYRDRCVWTRVEEQKLRVAYLSGEDLEVIAGNLGRATGAIRARIQVLGLRRLPGQTRTGRTVPVTTRRACLCCGQTFVSWGIGNRLCNRCRQDSSTILGHPYGGVLA